MGAPQAGLAHRLESEILTVRVPMRFERIGGRKAVIIPEGALESCGAAGLPGGPLLRALGRAHRWQRLLENGTYASAAELAAAEKINPSYLSRVLRLTLLAPDVVAAILAGGQAAPFPLLRLLKDIPKEWDAQRRRIRAPEAELS